MAGDGFPRGDEACRVSGRVVGQVVEMMPVEQDVQLLFQRAAEHRLQVGEQRGIDFQAVSAGFHVEVPRHRHADVVEALRGDAVDVLGGVTDAPRVGRRGFPAVAEVHAALDFGQGAVGGSVLAEALGRDETGKRGGLGVELEGDLPPGVELQRLGERAALAGWLLEISREAARHRRAAMRWRAAGLP